MLLGKRFFVGGRCLGDEGLVVLTDESWDGFNMSSYVADLSTFVERVLRDRTELCHNSGFVQTG